MANIEQEAVDHAFIRHVANLFDTFVGGLKLEPNYNRANSHARHELEKSYRFAKLAHEEMSAYIAKT